MSSDTVAGSATITSRPTLATASPPARAPLPLLLSTGAIIFLANAGLLVLQLLAGRYLAPFIGSSIETWTSVIGVFLAGIALGNWIGGKVADRYPSTRTLARLLGLGGLSVLIPIGAMLLCQKTGLHSAMPLGLRIPLLAALFCLVPATVLSMITPLVIKLATADVRWAGRVAGIAFALSTLGCLVGNYLTGFWLMAEYELNSICLGVSVTLLAAALLQAIANRLGHEPVVRPSSDAAGTTRPTPPEDRAEGGLDLRKNMVRAYAIVFVASFCGMSLELTGSRVLAPIVGVSLYSWTGIIGVMLAGTAAGNYLGGVLADKGVGAALGRFAVIACGIIGFALAVPTYVRATEPPLDSPVPEVYQAQKVDHKRWEDDLERRVWMVRGVGAAAGVGVACLGMLLARFRWGALMNWFIIGGFIGAVFSHSVGRQLSGLLGLNGFTRFHQGLSEKWGFDIGPYLIHAIGFIVGGFLAVALLSPSSPNAPRPSRSSILSGSLIVASILILIVIPSLGILSHYNPPPRKEITFLNSLGIVESVLAWTFALFFMPMLLLGTISPQVIRMSVPDLRHAGRTAGTIYAWSTVGAIAGTFVTGYFLIGSLGTLRVVMMLALLLVVLAFVVGKLWENSVMLYGASIVTGAVFVGMAIVGFDKVAGRSYDAETKYYAIQTYEDEKDGRLLTYLVLDHLTHSYVDLNDPTYLGYKHEESQGELLQLARERNKGTSIATNLLVIGGGGYTFPRWVETLLPDVNVEVVEIDPGVTEIAHRKLGLRRDTKIRTINMDGRQYVAEKAPKGHYQLVVQDAVNDLSVPYHLLTKEYNEAVKSLLTPDGAYLLTLIDPLGTGKLWRAAAHTMRETFPNVYLLAPVGTGFDLEGRQVYILYGSTRPLELKPASDAEEAASRRPRMPEEVRKLIESVHMARGMMIGGPALQDIVPWTRVLEPHDFEQVLNAASGKVYPKMILTDQYAPVDNLMSEVFRNR
jgi:spermidine synthase/MFS family permease